MDKVINNYDNSFESDSQNLGLITARVIKVNRLEYLVDTGSCHSRAQLPGNLVWNAQKPHDFPIIGDFVKIEPFEASEGVSIIKSILSRKSVLLRKSLMKKGGIQLLGANIDCVLIFHSFKTPLQTFWLTRCIEAVEKCKIDSFLILSMIDSVSEEVVKKTVTKVRQIQKTVKIFCISSKTKEGLVNLYNCLEKDKTYYLLGPSGSGKSTMVNKFLSEERFETSGVRLKDGKGRHTTTARTLVRLPNGSVFIDTPGIREIESID